MTQAASRKVLRKKTKQQARAAKSQMQAAHPDPGSLSYDIKGWERFRYYMRTREVAKSQKRFSLAMDATEVSKKKVMNATMGFPSETLHAWLPPMES